MEINGSNSHSHDMPSRGSKTTIKDNTTKDKICTESVAFESVYVNHGSNSHSHDMPSRVSKTTIKDNTTKDKICTESVAFESVYVNHGSNSHSHDMPSRVSKTTIKDNTTKDKICTESVAFESVYVNHAEIAWHQRRKEWVGDQSQKSQRMPREPIMSWTTTYEDLLSSTEPFQQQIPLAEMVDFLVDIWHEDGLYD